MYSPLKVLYWIALIAACLQLTGCVSFGGILMRFKEPRLHRIIPEKLKPRSDMFHMYPKDAPLKIQKAWHDGCKSGVYVMGGPTYRRFHRFSQDPALRKDPDYYRQWKDAYTFCRHYSYGVARIADARSGLITKQGSNANNYGWGDLLRPGNILNSSLLRVDGPERSAFFKNLKWPVLMDTWSLKPTTGPHMKVATDSLAHALDFRSSNFINHGSALNGLVMDWTLY